jgi:hypothetical protein
MVCSYQERFDERTVGPQQSNAIVWEISETGQEVVQVTLKKRHRERSRELWACHHRHGRIAAAKVSRHLNPTVEALQNSDRRK